MNDETGGHEHKHIVKRYDEELTQLRGMLLELGELALQHIDRAVRAMCEGNTELARNVVQSDAEVNALDQKVDETCVDLIARRQPMATDLRLIISVSKIATDLERVGDEANNIGRATMRLYDRDASDAPGAGMLRDVKSFAKMVSEMLEDALDAVRDEDTDKAFEVIRLDDEVDAEFQGILRRQTTYLLEDSRSFPKVLAVVFALKALERVGAHAVNVAEHVVFRVKGKDIRYINPEDLAESYLD
jgi:phosphate transport system protein